MRILLHLYAGIVPQRPSFKGGWTALFCQLRRVLRSPALRPDADRWGAARNEPKWQEEQTALLMRRVGMKAPA